MNTGITLKRSFRVRRGPKGRKALRREESNTTSPVGRVPRVARLMALAIHFDQLIHDGVVTCQAELARLGHVSRARLTQIMNLLNLAPDIQEQVLFLPAAMSGRNSVTERGLRPVLENVSWTDQRFVWGRLTASTAFGL